MATTAEILRTRLHQISKDLYRELHVNANTKIINYPGQGEGGNVLKVMCYDTCIGIKLPSGQWLFHCPEGSSETVVRRLNELRKIILGDRYQQIRMEKGKPYIQASDKVKNYLLTQEFFAN